MQLSEALALTAIIAAHLLGSLYWVAVNVVLVGHDASQYLWNSVRIHDLLATVNAQTLWAAITFSGYRAPGLFLAVQPLYRLLGPAADSAQLLNIALFGVVLWLTWRIGRDLAGRDVGLFAALLAGFFPLLFGMARLFYTEMFLTALVLLNLWALQRSGGFARRRWALLWGASLGLGMLVKWTMPIYIALPCAWALWQARGEEWRRTGPQRFGPGQLLRLAGAVALGLGLAALWYWPNRAAVAAFPLGGGMFWIGGALLGGLLYLLRRPGGRAANLAAGLLLAAAIAGLWYLPYIDFVQRLLEEDVERGQEFALLRPLENALAYWRYLRIEHFGTPALWLLLPPALLPWLAAARRRRSLAPGSGLLWLSILSALLALLMLMQRNPRNLTPLLPLLAVLAAVALFSYRARWRTAIGGLWLATLAIQWAFFTFDGLHPLYLQSQRLWARSTYLQPPASGATDPGFWIGPDLLAEVAAEGGEDEPWTLGVLINGDELHPGTLRYLAAAGGQPLEVRNLTDAGAEWAGALSSNWLLAGSGEQKDAEEAGRALSHRIAGGDPLFEALFAPVRTWPLPNGDTATLYARHAGPGFPYSAPEKVEQGRAVADALRRAYRPGATVLYATPDLAVWVGIHDAAPGVGIVMTSDAPPGDLALGDGPLLAVLDHESDALQGWLDRRGVQAQETGDDFAALAIYGVSDRPLEPLEASAAWGDIRVAALRTWATLPPGEVLPVELDWTGPTGQIKLSARLLNAQGKVAAALDRPLAAAGRFGLFLPPGAPPGPYTLAAVLYDPATGQELTDDQGRGLVPLASITVEPHPAQ